MEALISPELSEIIAENAATRRGNARAKGRQQRHFVAGTKWDSVDTEIQSMSAEYAVAHYFGQTDYEPVVGRPDRMDGDLTLNGHPVEVKSTDRSHGSLIVRKDALSRPYVLAVSRPPLILLSGWILSDDAKQSQWWRSDVRDPAYFVPQDALVPMSYLEDVLK